MLWSLALVGGLVSASPFAKEFLENAKLELFRGDLAIKLPNFELHVLAITCEDFTLAGLEINSTQSQGAYFPSVQLGPGEMRCTLDATTKDEEGELVGGQVILYLHSTFASTMFSFDTQTWPQEFSVLECVMGFDFDSQSMEIVGFADLHPYLQRFVEELFNALAPKMGSQVLNKVWCDAVHAAVGTVDFAWHVLQRVAGLAPTFWPSHLVVETLVTRHERNRSLLFAPYSDSLPVTLASSLINDLVGVRSRHNPLQLVANRVLDGKLGKEFALDLGDWATEFQVLQVPIKITLGSLTVAHLGTFKRIQLLHPKGKLTLGNVVEMHGPGVTFNLGLTVNNDLDFSLDGLSVSGLRLVMDFVLALDADVLSMAALDDWFGSCVLTALRAMQPVKLDMGVDRVVWPTLTSQADPKLAQWIQGLAQGFALPLTPSATQVQAMLKLFVWNLSPVLSLWVQRYDKCPTPECTQNGKYVEWPKLASMGQSVGNWLGSPANDVDFSISRLAEIAVEVLSTSPTRAVKKRGVLLVNREFAFGHTSLPFPGNNSSGSIWLSNLELGPVNDISKFEVLQRPALLPDDPLLVSNSISTNRKQELSIAFDLKVKLLGVLEPHAGDMHPKFRVHLQLSHLTVAITSLLQVLAQPSCLQLGQVVSLDACAFGLLGARVNPLFDLAIKFEHAKVLATCLPPHKQCELDFTREFLAKLASNQALLHDFLSQRVVPQVIGVITGQEVAYFDGFNATLGLERYIANQQAICARQGPSPSSPQPLASKRAVMRYITLIAGLCLAALGGLVGYSVAAVATSNQQQVRNATWLQYGITAALLFNFVVLASSSFFTVGELLVKLDVGPESLRKIPVEVITLDSLIDWLIHARAVWLALVLAVCSGLLPWLSAAMLGVCWLVEPSPLDTPVRLPVERRGNILRALERVSKFGLAQVVLLAVFTAALHVHLQVPQPGSDLEQFLLRGAFSSEVGFVPRWGLGLFLVAIWVGLGLTQFLLHLHRSEAAVEVATGDDEVQLPVKLLVGVVWPVALVCALSIDVLQIEFLGLGGLGQAPVSVSLGGVLAGLFSAHHVHWFAKLLLVLGYALGVLLGPIAHCLLSAVFCVASHTQANKRRIVAALRVAQAWSALEVAVVVVALVGLESGKLFRVWGGGSGDWVWLQEFGAASDQAVWFGVRPTLLPTGLGFLCLAVLLSLVADYQTAL
ncbi:hypothetical protein BASA81_001995 [Batrachochytrium salamandrivorans]|nr:hypothetical protein BASA81_001995 [Batrachochytrium salamandrivorans]